MSKVKCMICEKEYKRLPNHIKTHGINVEEYHNRFPGTKIIIDELNHKGKNNPAYGKPAWNKGLTKETDKRVEKYSGERPGSRPNLKEKQTEKTFEEIWGIEKASEMKRNISKAKIGTISWKRGLTKEDNESIMRTSEKLKGVPKTEKHKRNLRGKRGPNYKTRGKVVSEETRRKISENKERAKKISKALIGRKYTEETLKKMSVAAIKRCQNPKYLKSIIKSLLAKPNKGESSLFKVLEFLLPGEYKYNDGFFILGGKVPDFVNVNGKKKLIEYLGNHWHNKEETKKRGELFKQYGYDTLFIWESDFLDNQKEIINQILQFHNLSSLSCTKQLSIDDVKIGGASKFAHLR